MYFDFYNMDIYDTVLRDVLGVNPTGDVVADTVYLFVLPVLTLFLFSHHISGLLSLGKSKLQYVFMAIVFFFVIQRGYYPLVAQYSLFAFIVLMIWGAWTFITGKKYDDKGNPVNMKSYNMDVNNPGKFSVGSLLKGKITRGINENTGITDEVIRQQYHLAIKEGRGDDARKFQRMMQDNERNGNTGLLSKYKKSAS